MSDDEIPPRPCRSCRFFDEYDAEISGLGECRRYPPLVAVVPMDRGGRPVDAQDVQVVRPQNGGWPLVAALDWCGEWQSAAAAGAAVADPALAMNVRKLNLSVRPLKACNRLRLATVGELIEHTADDLLACHQFGMTSLNEVRSKLAQLGLKLKGD